MNYDSNAAQVQDRAYVLHSRSFKNTSLIIEVFSEHHGRFDLVARGAKRKDSPFLGLLQPFVPLFLVWGGRSELKTLYKAELVQRDAELKGDRMFAGFYVNELILYLLHKHEEHPELFVKYMQCLAQLAGTENLELILRYFELTLLQELGYGVSLEMTADTGELVSENEAYYYHFESGVSSVNFNEQMSVPISGSTLLALANKNLSVPEQKKQAKLLLRRILEYHLDGRPVKSRELFLKKNMN